MLFWRTTFWVITLMLPQQALVADSHREAQDFCQAQLSAGANPCHLQHCPCRPDETTLKRFEAIPGSATLCACSPPQTARQQAVRACDNYRRTQRQSCFISRGDCPKGFAALADFQDGGGTRFTACRDNRHAHSSSAYARPDIPTGEALLKNYQRLLDSLEAKRKGSPRTLPPASLNALHSAFRGFPLNELSLISTRALKQGCFTDCERLFCADDGQIERWTDAAQPLIDRNLLHQVIHAERCMREGGRDRFVSRWFQHLPDDVNAKLLAGEPLDASRIHFAMYMENHAKRRADALCRRLPGCPWE